MNDNAKKWVKALRSGIYKQGKGHLCNPLTDEYCCLGVAADLYVKEVGDITVEDDGSLRAYDGRDIYPPPAVVEWLGLDDSAGRYVKSGDSEIVVQAGGITTLAYNNDEDNLSFEQIADIIESEPKGLFNES